MENKNIKIGVIADDFTGASDAASFLSKSGAKTILFTNTPKSINSTCDAIVIALKSRSVKPSEAIAMTKIAVDFLTQVKCEKIYFKYCSTFDSQPTGNIGVVLDFLMEYLECPYTILCPSLPINGRTVKEGILYVNGIKLSDSPMKNHPLNPMWDSYIPILMKTQSKYPCFVVDNPLKNIELETIIQTYEKENEKFYLVPNYSNDKDGKWISQAFKELRLWSGGSGLLEHILDKKELTGYIHKQRDTKHQKTIILCGSCSRTTKKQIEHFIASGGQVYKLDSKKLLRGTICVEDIFSYIHSKRTTVLVYSSAVDEDMTVLQQGETFSLESEIIEKTLSDLSQIALLHRYKNIVVAGGETSGAVTLKLGFDSFYIGKSIDPGVPVLHPLQNESISLILKSGNFGSDDFFTKTIANKE